MISYNLGKHLRWAANLSPIQTSSSVTKRVSEISDCVFTPQLSVNRWVNAFCCFLFFCNRQNIQTQWNHQNWMSDFAELAPLKAPLNPDRQFELCSLDKKINVIFYWCSKKCFTMKWSELKQSKKCFSHLNILYDPLCTRFLSVPHHLNIECIKFCEHVKLKSALCQDWDASIPNTPFKVCKIQK